ncbi:BRO-N domain-containing protein [Streptomyces sp. NBC_01716]|uniref:BRO-N domain-containing protein n=1 Tax=Streptomyces sp. NBC_01716 TaxID=2975917 RepID=UPI002E320BB6|nr:Bro-N domain-containing protein [Streptomyces sp. NBC_01716]
MNGQIRPSDTAARHEAIDIGDFVYGATGTRIRRLTMPDGSHWFPAADVCRQLGYTTTRKTLTDHVPERHRDFLETVTGSHSLSIPAGREWRRDLQLIDLQGLILLVNGCTKPSCLPFKQWVSEVIVTVQGTGTYTLPRAEAQPAAPAATATPVAYALPPQVADAIVRLEERNIRLDEQFAAVQRESLETRREMLTAHQATARAMERIADRLDALIPDRPATPPHTTTPDAVLADWKSRMSVTEDVWAVAVTIAPALAADGELRQPLESIASRTGLTEHRVNECLRFMRKHACIHAWGSTVDGVPVYGLSPARPL